MKTYDQIALQDLPDILISSPVTTNQGYEDVTISGLPAEYGQSIIMGASNSFQINGSTRVSIPKNPIFYKSGATFECVLYFHAAPAVEVPIIADDATTVGLFANEHGFMLRLMLIRDDIEYPQEVQINIRDWTKKYYLTLFFTDNQAVLTVDGEVAELNIDFSPVSIPSSLHIGDGTISEWFLIDGVGFYTRQYSPKNSYINDADNGHKLLVGSMSGMSTEFETYDKGWSVDVSSSEFKTTGNYGDDFAVLGVQFPQSDSIPQFITVKCDDERVQFEWSIDTETWTAFKDKDTMPGDILNAALRYFGPRRDFTLHFEGVLNGSIEYGTPAILDITGSAIYPKNVVDSIVNCPDGAYLDGGMYSGTWLSDCNSVEIVFRPEEMLSGGYFEIYNSADGYARTGPGSNVISGFTAYLNGEPVANMTKTRMGQWNHLVLTKTSALAGFTINAANPKQLSLMSFAGYRGTLSQAQAVDLYKVLYGGDNLSVSESYGVVNEGIYTETGNAYNAYSYNWAVVSAAIH